VIREAGGGREKERMFWENKNPAQGVGNKGARYAILRGHRDARDELFHDGLHRGSGAGAQHRSKKSARGSNCLCVCSS